MAVSTPGNMSSATADARENAMDNDKENTMLGYCYRVQAWLVNGRVDKCGHREKFDGCYGCQHSGEQHECEGGCFTE